MNKQPAGDTAKKHKFETKQHTIKQQIFHHMDLSIDFGFANSAKFGDMGSNPRKAQFQKALQILVHSADDA
jgi:hypothetical protein